MSRGSSLARSAARERLDRLAAEQLGEIPHESAVVVAYDRASGSSRRRRVWRPDVITWCRHSLFSKRDRQGTCVLWRSPPFFRAKTRVAETRRNVQLGEA